MTVLHIEKLSYRNIYYIYTHDDFGKIMYVHKNRNKKYNAHSFGNLTSWDFLTNPANTESAFHASLIDALRWADKWGYVLKGCGLG